MIKHTLLFLTLFFIFGLQAQTANILGKIISASGDSIPFANIGLLNTNYGVSSDKSGEFLLKNIPLGNYTLTISNVGYHRFEHTLNLTTSQLLDLGVITLQENALGLKEVVVTGTMKEVFVKNSPVKVQVISTDYLQKNIAPTNLVEGMILVSGVQENVACGVCFTNSISVNGLPGAYTAVLIDGTPLYGSLASLYGLNSIPTQIIERFEVIKGPNATLYGSEAVAGVINVITKDPTTQPLISVDLMSSSRLETFGNIALAANIGRFHGYAGFNYGYANIFEDSNKDGFGDIINFDRLSGFTKWSMERPNNKKLTLAAKYYYEDRRNGVAAFLQKRAYRKLRGNNMTYGESIYTKRAEVFGTYEFQSSEYLKIDYSFSSHWQDSYYGTDYYEAKQYVGFSNFIWNKALSSHDVLAGLSVRYQRYDDNTVATGDTFSDVFKNQPDVQFIPGVFLQDEWKSDKKLSLLLGTRLDYYSVHGLILSPRLNVKYTPSTWTTLRANLGTGFRTVNLFTEDHAFVTGQRSVEILEDLNPEQSYNLSLNLNHVYTLGNGQGSIDIDIYYTYFTNKIIPDYKQPGKIIYANTKGYAITKGLGFTLSHQFMFPLSIEASINLQQAIETEPNASGTMQRRNIEFAPAWTGVSVINYTWKKTALTFAYTFNLTGAMALPEVFDLDEDGVPLTTSRTTRSVAFGFHNLQVSKTFKNKNMTLYAGIQNIFDYRQNTSPLSGYNDPNATPGFSEFFDTAYAFSPIQGREVYLGFRWNFSKHEN